MAGAANLVTSGTFGAGGQAPSWCTAPPAPSDIISTLITRGLTFGSPDIPKNILRGEHNFLQRGPKVTNTIINSMPFDDEVTDTDKTYSKVKYTVSGQLDWDPDNSNDDFQTPFRETYAPVDIPLAGINTGVAGIGLDEDRESSLFFRSGAIAPWFQIKSVNEQGFIRHKSFALTGLQQPFARTRSI